MQIIKLDCFVSSHFELIEYPDGQRCVRLNMDDLDIKKPIRVECKIRTFSQLEILGCLLSALYKNDFYVKHLHFDYLFGIRSDRAFQEGEPNYCRDVLAPVINTWMHNYNIESMSILWPFQPLPIKNNYFDNACAIYKHDTAIKLPSTIVRIGGDESASFFEGIETSGYFIKHRNDGNIEVKMYDSTLDFIRKQDKILIVDDLCDGGATFIAEARYLKQKFPNIEINLFVYHGLFTKGVDHLLDYFTKIYSTNSYQHVPHPRIIYV